MGNVFRNAWVTILATSASSVQGGFLGPRELWRAACLSSITLPWTTPQEGTGSVILWQYVKDEADEQYIHQDPIHARAWTFQEHLLSFKLFVYSKQQLFFTCREIRPWKQGNSKEGSFTTINTDTTPLRNGNRVTDGFVRSWTSIVEGISAR